MALSLLISAWLVGALGGLHCVAMCGGLLTALAARDGSAQPLLPARGVAMRQLAYHAGRVATYVCWIGVRGAARGAERRFPPPAPLYSSQRFSLLSHQHCARSPLRGLQRAGAQAFGVVLPSVLRAAAAWASDAFAGFVWGWSRLRWLQCFACAVLRVAWEGGGDARFGVWTVPNL